MILFFFFFFEWMNGQQDRWMVVGWQPKPVLFPQYVWTLTPNAADLPKMLGGLCCVAESGYRPSLNLGSLIYKLGCSEGRMQWCKSRAKYGAGIERALKMPAASFGERTSILSLSPETFLASELTAGQELQWGQKLEEPVAGLSPLPQPHCAPGVSHSPFLTLYRLIYETEKTIFAPKWQPGGQL